MVNISNELGSISITSEVFTNIAGAAATSCFGVKGMEGRRPAPASQTRINVKGRYDPS